MNNKNEAVESLCRSPFHSKAYGRETWSGSRPIPLRYGDLDRVKLQIAVIAGINYEFSFLALFSRVGSILCWRCLDKDQEKLGIGEVKQRTIQNMTLC
jgi:hypothetical protein